MYSPGKSFSPQKCSPKNTGHYDILHEAEQRDYEQVRYDYEPVRRDHQKVRRHYEDVSSFGKDYSAEEKSDYYCKVNDSYENLKAFQSPNYENYQPKYQGESFNKFNQTQLINEY